MAATFGPPAARHDARNPVEESDGARLHRQSNLPPSVRSRGHGQTDLKDRRIRVNAVSPGSIDTPGLSDLLASAETGQQRLKMLSNSVPLGRFGTSDEIAKAVVFLASDDSSYITGTELFVDGGFAQV